MQLKELLGLLYEATRRWSTLRATLRATYDLDKGRIAVEQQRNRLAGHPNSAQGVQGPGTSSGPIGTERAMPAIETTQLELTARAGGFLRLVSQRPWRNESVEVIKVINPESWWISSPPYGVETSSVIPPPRPPFPTGSLGQEEFFLEPALLISRIQIESYKLSQWNNRRAFSIHARDRTFLQRPVEGLWAGAEAYELVIDAERGVPLLLAAIASGERFAAMEVQQIEYDVLVPDSVFSLHVPNGVPIHAPGHGRTLKPRLANWWRDSQNG